MSRLSEDRISGIAHNIVNYLIKNHSIDPTRRGELLAALKEGVFDFEIFNDRIDEQVKEKIASLSKKVPEGSNEWRILYLKYRSELLKKQRIHTI